MLGDYPVDVVLLAPDVEASKAFYANKVGLKIINAASDRVRFQCGGDSPGKSCVGMIQIKQT